MILIEIGEIKTSEYNSRLSFILWNYSAESAKWFELFVVIEMQLVLLSIIPCIELSPKIHYETMEEFVVLVVVLDLVESAAVTGRRLSCWWICNGIVFGPSGWFWIVSSRRRCCSKLVLVLTVYRPFRSCLTISSWCKGILEGSSFRSLTWNSSWPLLPPNSLRSKTSFFFSLDGRVSLTPRFRYM